MKRLFRAIFVVVLIFLGTPTLLATLMYDGSGEDALPTHLYTEDADAEAMLLEELDGSFQDILDGEEGDFIFNLHEDVINTAIFQAIREHNPSYMPTSDCNDDACNYIDVEYQQFEDFQVALRAVGAWVDFEDGEVTFNTFLEVSGDDVGTYKTIIKVKFLVEEYTDKYVIDFDGVKIGNLPIPATFIASIMNEVVDPAEYSDEVPIGTLNSETLTYTLLKSDIINSIQPEEGATEETIQSVKLMQELVKIVFDNGLVNLDFNTDEFVFSARLSMFTTSDEVSAPEYLDELHYVLEDGTLGGFNPDALQVETYFETMFTEFVVNSAITGENFKITEDVLNKLVYASAEGFEELKGQQEYLDANGETKFLEYGVEGMWFEIEPDAIYANMLINIGGIQSLTQFKANVVQIDPKTISLEFTEVNIGKDALEVEGQFLLVDDVVVFNEALSSFINVDFATFTEDYKLVINADDLVALMETGNTTDGTIVIDQLFASDGALEIDIQPADTELSAALDAFRDEVVNVIESEEFITNIGTVLDSTDPEQAEVLDAVTSLQESLIADPENVDPAQIETLFNEIEDLDDATQTAFFETLMDSIDPTVFDNFTGLFEDEEATQ